MDENKVLLQSHTNATPINTHSNPQNIQSPGTFAGNLQTTDQETTDRQYDESMETLEDRERRIYGNYYELSTHMKGVRHLHLAQQIDKLKVTSEEINSQMAAFDAAYNKAFGLLDQLQCSQKTKEGFPVLKAYKENVKAENDQMKAFFEAEIGKPADEYAAVDDQNILLALISKVNYVRNQHALSLRMIVSYLDTFNSEGFTEKPEQSEHVISAVGSMLTAFNKEPDQSFDHISVETSVVRAEVIKNMLLTRSSRHAFRALTPRQSVNKLKQDMVDEAFKLISNPANSEKEALNRQIDDRFNALTSHDEGNAYSFFWIPTPLVKDKTTGKNEAEIDIEQYQIDKMDEAVLSRYGLAYYCASLKSKYASDTATGFLAEQYEKALFDIVHIMHKYSLYAHIETEKILANKGKAAKDKKEEIDKIIGDMAELSSHHGYVCVRLLETLKAYSEAMKDRKLSEIGERDKFKLETIEGAANKFVNINPGTEFLKNKEKSLGESQKRCEEAVQAFDDFERVSCALLTSSVRNVNDKTTEVSGDESKRKGTQVVAGFQKELRGLSRVDAQSMGNVRELTGTSLQTDTVRDTSVQESEQAVRQAQEIEMVSKMDHLTGNMEKHIPQKEMQKLKSFKVNGQQREGVSKFRAYRIRKGKVWDKRLESAVEDHVDRMLSSGDLSDMDLANVASNIGESTGVISKDMFESKLAGKEDTVLYLRLSKYKELAGKVNGSDIKSISEDIRSILGAQDEKELDLENPYFTKYPQSLKVVLMYKLIKDINMPGNDKTSREVRDRLTAAKTGVKKLYETLINSGDYKKAYTNQVKEAVTYERTVKSDHIFDTSGGIVTVPIVTVDEWNNYLEYNRQLTSSGLQTRLEYSQNAHEALIREQRVREEELRRHNQLTKEEQETLIRNNYRRALKHVSEYTAKDKVGRLVRKPVQLPPYLERVGEGAIDSILYDNLKDMLYPYYVEAGLEAVYTGDKDTLLSNVKKYAAKIGYGGVKKPDDLGQLTLGQVKELAALVTSRVSGYPGFINQVTGALSNNQSVILTNIQRDTILRYMFSDKELSVNEAVAMIQALNDRTAFLEQNKNAILYGGKEAVVSRFFCDMTKLQANTSLFDLELRVGNRQGRMETIEYKIKRLCSGVGADIPKSFYEFVSENKTAGNDIVIKEKYISDLLKKREYKKMIEDLVGSQKKTMSEVKKQIEDDHKAKIAAAIEKEFTNQYNTYIKDTWYKAFENKDSLNKTKPLTEVKNLLLKDEGYRYFGIIKYGAALSDALGVINKDGTEEEKLDVINGTERGRFEQLLSSRVINQIIDKEVMIRQYCKEKNVSATDALIRQLSVRYSNPDFEGIMHSTVDGLASKKAKEFDLVIEKRDRRVKTLKESGYALLLPVLFEHSEFTDHLVADNDFEYEDFLTEYLPRAKEVAEEIEIHPYTEQYLIGKKQEILSYIFDPSCVGKKVKAFLNLDAYDKEVEGTVVKGKESSSKQITIGSMLREALTKRDSVGGNAESSSFEKISLEDGNLYSMVLLFDGVGAIFNKDTMTKYQDRVKNNTKSLNDAIAIAFRERESSGIKYKDKRKEAIIKSIFQNERRNIVLVDDTEYVKDVAFQVDEWFVQNDVTEMSEIENATVRASIEKNMKDLIDIKNLGRSRFADYFAETDKMRQMNIELFNQRVETEGSKKAAEDYYKAKYNDIDENVVEIIKTFFSTEKDQLPENGILNSLYNETLVRMSYHASMENIQQAQIELLKDHNIFMKTRHFYKIADTFLKNHDMTKDFDDKTRGNVIGGLLNLFGEQLVSFDYNVEDDVINEVLGGLFDKDKVGNEILRLLESDTGGYYGVGSDGYNYSDSPLIRLDRNGFDTKLEKMAGGNRELQSVFDSYKALGNGEKVLVGHLLVRDNELFNPSSFFVKTLLDESLQSESRTNVILGYMKGVQLVEPDYKQAMEALSSDLPVMAGRLKAALQLAEQIHNLKTVDGLTVTTAEYNALLDASHTELVDQEKKASEKYDGIEAVYSLSKEVEKDFKSEKLRTNSDKMWSFYTALRPYEKELADYNAIYEETVRSIDEEAQAEVLTKEKQSEKDEVLKRARTRKNHYRHMHELYERYVELKGYTVTMQQLMDAERDFKEAKNEDNKLEALKAIYRSRKKMAETESSYVQKLGLNDMKDWIAQADDSLIEGSASIDEYLQALGQNSEHVREEFDAFLDTQVFRVDGVKTKSTIKRSDKDEEEFPKEVAEAVLEIDKWVARNGNSLSRGNSETTFGADILSHPMRERLFVYYMVEKQFVGKATGADIAMAVNGYIPNLDKFKEAMEAPVYKIHQYLISAIKDSDVIRNHEFIRSKLARFGSVNLELLESSMRLLDDEKSDVSGQLERYKNSLKTDFGDVLAHHPGDKAVEDYAKAWEDRQKKLVALLKELEKLRALSQISDEAIIGKEEKFAAAQAQVIVVRDYITMLQAAETKLGDLEAGPGTKERLGQALGRKVSVRADSPTTGEKIDGYAAKVSKLTGLLSTADTKVFNTGVFATVNGVAALAKIITACFAPDYDDDHISVSNRLNEAEKILDSISAAAKPVAEMIKSVLKSTSATFTTVGGAVSGGVTAFTGLLDVGKTTSELISLNQAVEQIESDRQQTQSKSHTIDKKGKVSEANAKSERIEKERKRAEENTARMQKRKLETRRQQAAIKAVGGAVSMATALVPGLNIVGAAVGGVITAVGLIHKFYKEGENRDSTLDEFIGMEDILKEYRKSKGIMGYTEPEAKEKEDRAVIRKMILRKFHFSSAEEFFNDISMKYAQILYEQIFFKDDGTLVLGGDEAAIEERRKYTGLFPELKFGWPVKEGDPPYPSVDELAANLMKVS